MANSQDIKQYFSDNNGFGNFKHVAIDLLKKTINMLNEFKIGYFMISGSLLGYVRHNDFIPWDDDIDLIVDETIFTKMPHIAKKYGSSINFMVRDYLIKTCFKDKVHELVCEWNDYAINKDDKYNWPFIDMFIYKIPNDKTITFFNKKWEQKHFFPAKTVLFNSLDVMIPKNPNYFLAINYGGNYMTSLVSNKYEHKTERSNKKIIRISMDEYEKYK